MTERATTPAGNWMGNTRQTDRITASCRRKKFLFASYTLAKEGLDIPCLERLYLTTPKKDYAVITQSIGRIARTHPGKQKPVCFDFVDNISYLVKTYKKRCATYRKQGCEII